MSKTTDPTIAFLVHEHERPRLEIRVNFGIFAGRKATAAEIDHLAEKLLDEIDAVTIVAEERHEIGGHAEASVHQVRIQLAGDQVPPGGPARTQLEQRLLDLTDLWARSCIADRHGEVTEI